MNVFLFLMAISFQANAHSERQVVMMNKMIKTISYECSGNMQMRFDHRDQNRTFSSGFLEDSKTIKLKSKTELALYPSYQSGCDGQLCSYLVDGMYLYIKDMLLIRIEHHKGLQIGEISATGFEVEFSDSYPGRYVNGYVGTCSFSYE